MVVVKYGIKWMDKMSWFFTCWYKCSKAKSYLVKNGGGCIDHGTLKSGVSHNWFDEPSRWIESFLHGDSDGIFGLMANLLCICDV